MCALVYVCVCLCLFTRNNGNDFLSKDARGILCKPCFEQVDIFKAQLMVCGQPSWGGTEAGRSVVYLGCSSPNQKEEGLIPNVLEA